MAIGQLRAIADKATLLANMLTPQSTLEPWVLSLISVAEYQVDAVSDYFKYSGAGSPASQTLTAATNQEAKKGLNMNKTLHRSVPSDVIEKSLTSTIAKRQKTFGGKERDELRDEDFVIPDDRKFPIMTAADVDDAVKSWGRYAGGRNASINFDTFKDRLIALATKKGFKEALPDTWLEEMEEDVTPDKEAFDKYYFFKAANPEQRVVVGYASSERIDGQNDIVDAEALQQALDDYMQWANLREMHQPKAVGKVLQATPVKGKIRLSDGTVLVNPLRIIAKIVDEDAWQKVKSGILKGFSIGGKVINSVTQKINGKDVRRITGLSLNEISLVDRPANPDARIVMMKRDSSVLDKVELEKMVKGGMVDDLILKAKMADPQEILPMIQQLRNQAEVDGDLDTAERYNEVITLMLEAMGIIPTGTVREMDDMESPDILDNTPDDDMDSMVDMEAIYGESGEEEEKALKRRNSIMYAAGSDDDLLKIGRAISKNNMDTLADILSAANIIRTLCAKLGLELKEEESEEHEGEEHDHGGEGKGMVAVAVKPVAAEVTTVESMTPTMPASKEQAVLDAIDAAPQKMMPGNNTGSPIHTPMNPNAPAQNVTGGYPIQRNAQNGDLQKQDAADAVDITGLEKEMQSMEQTIDNATPAQPAEETSTTAAPQVEETAKADATPPAIDVSAALQDVIAKSLQGALAGTFAQLETVAKAVERIETKSTEQSTAVWDALKPLTESVNATKGIVEPLVEKVSALETVAAEVKALGERLSAIEAQPEAGGPMLRGQTVNKALGVVGAAGEEQQDEISTLSKMIDETHDPLVRTKLRERLAHLETKKALFGRI